MCLTVGSAQSVNNIHTLFQRIVNYLKSNPNESVFGSGRGDLVSVSDWPEIADLAKLLSDNYFQVN